MTTKRSNDYAGDIDIAQATFEPEHIPFSEGKNRIEEALKKVGHKMNSRILTSRDKEAVALCNLLGVPNEKLPAGFTKWQLPFYLDGGQFFITTTVPNAEVGEHSHDDDGVRFIMSGSVYYDGIELNAGDWMYIPKNKRYSLKVGPLGASMCYCYQCCCVPRELSWSELINPAPFVRVRGSLSYNTRERLNQIQTMNKLYIVTRLYQVVAPTFTLEKVMADILKGMEDQTKAQAKIDHPGLHPVINRDKFTGIHIGGKVFLSYVGMKGELFQKFTPEPQTHPDYQEYRAGVTVTIQWVIDDPWVMDGTGKFGGAEERPALVDRDKLVKNLYTLLVPLLF